MTAYSPIHLGCHHYDDTYEHGWGDPLPLRHRVSNPFVLLERQARPASRVSG